MGNAAYVSCADDTVLARVVSAEEIDMVGTAVVFLNVYDLNEDWLQANSIFNDVLQIGGAFHTGVEIFGQEWSYGQEGVSPARPRCHEVHVFRQSVPMGITDRMPHEVMQLVEGELSPKWQGSDYHLLRRNCCSWSDALCRRLVNKPIPGWVNRFPKVASAATRGLGNVVSFGASVSGATPRSPATPRGDATDSQRLGWAISNYTLFSEETDINVWSPMVSPTASMEVVQCQRLLCGCEASRREQLGGPSHPRLFSGDTTTTRDDSGGEAEEWEVPEDDARPAHDLLRPTAEPI